jgi:hypothetical protein
MASRRADTDEEVLVDVNNAATASLFSPNMWVHRPSRVDRTGMMEGDGGAQQR